jgi:cobalt/nickel transport system permease protein
VAASFARFAAIFALTQVPLAVSEGILTALIFNALPELKALGALPGATRP